MASKLNLLVLVPLVLTEAPLGSFVWAASSSMELVEELVFQADGAFEGRTLYCH